MKSETCTVHSVKVGLMRGGQFCVDVKLVRADGNFLIFGERVMYLAGEYDCGGYWVTRLCEMFQVEDVYSLVGRPVIAFFVDSPFSSEVEGITHPLNTNRFFPDEEASFQKANSMADIGKLIEHVYPKSTVESFMDQLEEQKHQAAMKYQKGPDPKTVTEECLKYGILQGVIVDYEYHFGVKSPRTTARGRLEVLADRGEV